MWAGNSRGRSAARAAPGRALVACMAGAVVGVSTSCAVGPDFQRPAAPAVNHYVQGVDPSATVVADGAAQAFRPGAPMIADWWHLFGSAKLDALIGEALANNPGLEAAQASLRASQDDLRSGYGVFYPSVDAAAAATRERYSPANLGERSPGVIFNLFTLSASVSYALDVFGGQRRTVEGLRAQVAQANAEEQATYLTLLANIVNAVVARAAYKAELEATQQLIDLQQQQVHLAEVQAQAGTAPYSSVLSLRSQQESNQATLAQLAQKLAQSEDLLAALVGKAPAEWQASQVTLADLALPRELPVSLPSELVRQRPDILAAEASMHVASANIGVTTAALFPSVTLGGSVEAASNSTRTLFPSNGKAWSVSASATAPLFEGGTLWFKRKAAIAGYQQAAALYRQTVLAAFQQVADTLRALDHDAMALSAEQQAQADAAEALHLLQANYEAGLATYLEVLNADVQYHQAQIAELQAVAVRYQDTVGLFAALGGGWWAAAHSAAAP
jgi:NodT family efflux transporter outer membrane factor (OMF) lipoprotein